MFFASNWALTGDVKNISNNLLLNPKDYPTSIIRTSTHQSFINTTNHLSSYPSNQPPHIDSSINIPIYCYAQAPIYLSIVTPKHPSTYLPIYSSKHSVSYPTISQTNQRPNYPSLYSLLYQHICIYP